MMLFPELMTPEEAKRVYSVQIHPRDFDPVAVPFVPSRKARMLEAVTKSAEAHNVSVESVFSKTRRRHSARARHVAVWLMHNTYGWNVSDIGRLFNRHHTTAINSIRRVEGLRSKYINVRMLTDRLRREMTYRGVL